MNDQEAALSYLLESARRYTDAYRASIRSNDDDNASLDAAVSNLEAAAKEYARLAA